MAARTNGTDPGSQTDRPVPPWQHGADPSQSAWRPGTRLGTFRLERLLGLGSFGEVWEAADHTVPDAPRRVAVKILSVFGVPGGLEALEREAAVCRELNHPNIIEILGLQSSDDAAWVVMEFVPGPTLQQANRLLADRGLRMPRVPLLDIGIGITRALESAWTATNRDGDVLKIVHRNLRPAEILISEEGLVKVGGFSLARLAEDDRKTSTGVIRGSPTYIPPERWRGSNSYTPASDLYSLGVLLWEAAVGGRFFPKIHVGEMFELIERRTAAEEAAVAGVLFPELAPLLERLLQREPGDRPQTAREVRLELQSLRDSIAGEGTLEQFVWMLGALDEDVEASSDVETLDMAWEQLVESAEESLKPDTGLDHKALSAAFQSPNAASMSTGFWDDREWSREDWQDWMPATWSRSQPELPPVPEPAATPRRSPAVAATPKRSPAAPPDGSDRTRRVVVGALSLALVALAVVFVLVVLERFG